MKKQILFLCVANSARSQMAEGLARLVLGDEYHIESAGSKASEVNPLAIQVMRESDIDLTAHKSKSWEALPESFMKNLDYVITLCVEADEACPVLPFKTRKMSWGMEDPKDLESFRKTRDSIHKKIIELKSLLESN